jgi:hypothetical protein
MSSLRTVFALGVTLLMLSLSTPARADEPSESAPSTGWSLGASIGGLALGAVSLSLGLVAMTTFDGENEEGANEYGALGPAMAASSMAVTALAGPLVWLGSRSARQSSPEVRGLPSLRGIGWLFYGTQLLVLSAVVGLAASGEQVDGWLSAVGGAMGLISLNAFAIDAMVAWHEARSLSTGD